MFLVGVRQRQPFDAPDYPFNLPFLQDFHLELKVPVTFLVGENGSGKSTLLEAVAHAASQITVGGFDINEDPTLDGSRRLGEKLTLSWRKRTRRGFFMRAEDFFGYSQRLQALAAELEQTAADFEEQYEGYARQLAVGAARGQIQELRARYGEGLDHRSHGEAFLALFQERFVPDGLYLLDEPETPLSPQRQLAFLALLKEMVGEGAQFIIATHSPILMAFPGAQVLVFEDDEILERPYDELEHVRLTRDFLNCPERYLRYL